MIIGTTPRTPAETASFHPIRVIEVELSRPLLVEPATDRRGQPYERVRVLARLHGWPLGMLEVGSVEAEDLAEAIHRALGAEIAAHLAADGVDRLVEPASLVLGVGRVDEPVCLESRRRVLADPPGVSVVVPTVDRPAALRRCLEGLAEQSYPRFEVIVVDNAPGVSGAERVVDALAERVPNLRRVEEPRRGASRARNRGLRASREELVAFLDGDVRPDRDWLAATVTALVAPVGGSGEARPVDCVTGLIVPSSLETPSQVWMEEWGGYAKGFEPRWFDLREHRPPGPLFPYAIAVCGSGASMAFRRADVLAIGGFDPALGGGTPAGSGEDLALLLDVVAGGGTVAYEPGAIVWHEHPDTEDALRSTLRSYGAGLSGYVARHAARHPIEAVRIASRLPAAASYLLRPTSGRNHRRSADFPSWVLAEELRGMAVGPFAYAAGRRPARRLRASRVANRPSINTGARAHGP